MAALGVGLLSGFFGIGGGFLIVPGLLLSTGMAMIDAVGSSLLAVGGFGLTTAVSYAFSGLVDWLVAIEYIAGGLLGGWLGMLLAVRLAPRKALLLHRLAVTLRIRQGQLTLHWSFPFRLTRRIEDASASRESLFRQANLQRTIRRR